MEEEALEICKEARAKGLPEDERTAKLIYDNIFRRDEAHYRNWETASYQAPETHEGFALHLCLYTAIKIRELDQAPQSKVMTGE